MNRSDDRRDSPDSRSTPASQGQPQRPAQDAGADKEHGEGNYKATRDYDRGLKEHMRTHDTEREARDAAPRSEDEAREMKRAEDLGRKKADGMRDPKDRMDRTDSGEGGVK